MPQKSDPSNLPMTKNLLSDIPDRLARELFDTLAESGHVKIERIISKGHTTPDSHWYDQEQNEFVVIIKGEAVIEFESSSSHLHAGDFMIIPAHCRHKVAWTPPDTETIWLAVHYR